MYVLLKNNQLLGIFTTKKLMRKACEIIVKDDYQTTGTYGWYHFRYCKIEPNVFSKPLVTLFTLHPEYFTEIENDPNTGEILDFQI